MTAEAGDWLKALSKKYDIRIGSARYDRLRARAKKYGLTTLQLLELHDKQEGRCRICGTDCQIFAADVPDVLQAVIDHCHVTGTVRGILCSGCNVQVGHLERVPVARIEEHLKWRLDPTSVERPKRGWGFIEKMEFELLVELLSYILDNANITPAPGTKIIKTYRRKAWFRDVSGTQRVFHGKAVPYVTYEAMASFIKDTQLKCEVKDYRESYVYKADRDIWIIMDEAADPKAVKRFITRYVSGYQDVADDEAIP
ncbi:endonuclease VII domain-containing protein [Siccirubricoccus sp. KC 17139]|uniref:Endonuclease VII domain-containing protein n=1 Tax=Siccirubricoccus soli TaxID=2899147 RepID=A0ABT1CYR5_9PROT|nr:endonuclease domain-containing protein [Siccirubricoccus soli]MCO6414796.1 endonuclease VII domain-containing protein [Siccirubricoccus soli]MCP2680926.1 endonuclease VII domain-containing protein [Siccirubricoccus soli]